MGTRGAYGFHVNGKDKVTYNHFDSYPSGLGADVVRFIQETDDAELERIANKIVLVDEGGRPTGRQVVQCSDAGTVNLGVSEQSLEDWYCLLRNAQGDLNVYKGDLPYMIDSASFLSDSLFCEWAYIINLDTEELEVYEGFNKRPDAPGRYANTETDNGYFGVKLIDVVNLEDVRNRDADGLVAQWEAEED